MPKAFGAETSSSFKTRGVFFINQKDTKRKARVITKSGKESGTLEIAFFDKDDLARIANILAALE